MQPSDDSHGPVARGAVAGLLAATALIIWFFFVDVIAGEALRTPRFLAGIFFAQEEVGIGLLVFYTVLHYAVFVVAGIVVALFLSGIPAAPNALLGGVLGFLLFDLMFYAGVVITGVNVVEALGWPAVLAGNLLAGITLTAWLRRQSPTPNRSWLQALDEHRIVREGLMAGLIGAAAVAVWFLVFDVVLREPFFTPAALGSAFFFGAGRPAAVEITAASVLGYTLAHFAAFIAVGLIAAAIAAEAEHHPELLLAFVLIFVTLGALFIGLAAIAAAWVLGALGWWAVAAGTLIAAMAMGGYLWRKHPALRAELRRPSLEEPA